MSPGNLLEIIPADLLDTLNSFLARQCNLKALDSTRLWFHYV